MIDCFVSLVHIIRIYFTEEFENTCGETLLEAFVYWEPINLVKMYSSGVLSVVLLQAETYTLFSKNCNFLHFLLEFGYRAANARSNFSWISALNKCLLMFFWRQPVFFCIKTFFLRYLLCNIQNTSNISHFWVLFNFDVFVRVIYLSYWFRSMFWRKANEFCFFFTKRYV